jgi:hypothetical protein
VGKPKGRKNLHLNSFVFHWVYLFPRYSCRKNSNLLAIYGSLYRWCLSIINIINLLLLPPYTSINVQTKDEGQFR